MNRRVLLSTYGVVVLALLVVRLGAQQSQPAGITWDFETGNLRGWQASGTAFAAQPTFGDNTLARHSGSANLQGRYWIGTFERYQGPGRGQPGGVQGDRPQGTLTSIPFTIPQSLTFRIGGGSAFETRVELLVADQIEGESRVVFASGRNAETMQDVTWNLDRWAGRQGRIRIVDAASGGWGHINADDFRLGSSSLGRFEVLPAQPAGRGRATVLPRLTTVPDLLGHTEQEARGLIGSARLTVGRIATRQADARPGTVLSQDRDPGTRVPVNTSLGFVLAVPVMVTVPNVVGSQERAATTIIAEAHMRVGAIRRQPSRSPLGQVLAQGTRPGQLVPEGSALELVVAALPTVSVPPIVGRLEADAVTMLRRTGLVPGAIAFEESRQPEGIVLSAQPPPGQTVVIGTAVDLVTAVPVTAIVPAMIGSTEDRARNLLTAAELVPGTIEYQESAGQPGMVLAQSLDQGTRVQVGTRVNLVVGVVETVRVPSVVGMSRDQARRSLLDGRLSVGPEDLRATRGEPQGTVLAQSVQAGTRTSVGTAIALTVAIPEMASVPEVVGLSHAAAAASISGAGLAVGAVTPRFSIRAGGTVLDQALAPGAQVRFGTPVPLDEARPRIIWMAPAGVLLLAGIAGFVRLRTHRVASESPQSGSDPLPPLKVEALADVDAGTAVVHADERPVVRQEVRVQLVIDRGTQDVSAEARDIIESERRERTRGASRPENTS